VSQVFVIDDEAAIGENIERMLRPGEIRVTSFQDPAAGLAAASTEADVLSAVREQLGKNTKDVPFSLTYLFDAQGRAVLATDAGIDTSSDARHPAACPVIEDGADAPWPARTLSASLPPSILANLATISPERA